METGQVVFSKAGRDKRRPFVVVAAEGEYLYIADGKTRLLHKPKKKKDKHLQPTNTILSDLKHKLDHSLHIDDADLRKALLPFK